MFASFLMPHIDRGAGPLFHLIMLFQMSRFAPEEICFLGDDVYFDEQHVPFGEELLLGTSRFTCVSQERFRAYRKAALPFEAVAALYEDGRSHLDAFQSLLTADHPPLRDAILAGLAGMNVEPGTLEAFLTWSNCPALSALAATLGVPVIHNELGPLRAPAYQDTVFFDFEGVNGNSTPATRWRERDVLAAQLDGADCLPTAQLRALLYQGSMPADDEAANPPVRYPLGVALQVEDDSNTVAYGRGYDATRLLYRALRDLAPEQVLVRSHPSARFAYRGGLGLADDSPSSLAFLRRIAHLVTINSSVAAEAALWGVPFTTFGDTPFAVLSSPMDTGAAPPPPSADVPDITLNALLVAYLVPATLLFDPEYYRWRLGGATLRDCFERHLGVFKRQATRAQATALPALRDPVLGVPPAATPGMPHRNSALWSATRSVTRDAARQQAQIASLTARGEELEAQLASVMAERDKIWDERCWFQTNLERVEQEILGLHGERDTLHAALAEQQEKLATELKAHVATVVAAAVGAEAEAVRTRHAEIERVLTALNGRVDELGQLRARHEETVRALAALNGRVNELGELRARHSETEDALATLNDRFDSLGVLLTDAQRRYATAEAQSDALLGELNRTMLERIEALGRVEQPDIKK
jgi:peptidoglycan hydrolase CwlO-like protein